MGEEHQAEPILVERQRAEVARLHLAAAHVAEGEESYQKNLDAEVKTASERMERSCAAHAKRLAELEPKARSSLRGAGLEGLWIGSGSLIKPPLSRNIPITELTNALEFADRALARLESSVTCLKDWRGKRERTRIRREFLWGMLAVLIMMILVWVWTWLAHW